MRLSPSRFLQTRSCKWCPSKGTGAEDASLQKLLDLQRWPCHRLGGCSDTHMDDRGQRESADHPIGLFRLLYRLGVDDDCPIRLPTAKALGVEPPLGVISSIDPPCGPQASNTQLTPGLLALIFFRKSWPKGSLPLLSEVEASPCRENCPANVQRKAACNQLPVTLSGNTFLATQQRKWHWLHECRLPRTIP